MKKEYISPWHIQVAHVGREVVTMDSFFKIEDDDFGDDDDFSDRDDSIDWEN